MYVYLHKINIGLYMIPATDQIYFMNIFFKQNFQNCSTDFVCTASISILAN